MTTTTQSPNTSRDAGEKTARAVLSRLADSGYTSLANVACEYRDGVVVLRGRVPSFHMKQVAQTCVAEVDGVERIDNRLQVVYP